MIMQHVRDNFTAEASWNPFLGFVFSSFIFVVVVVYENSFLERLWPSTTGGLCFVVFFNFFV